MMGKPKRSVLTLAETKARLEEWNPETHLAPLGSDELYRLAMGIVEAWEDETHKQAEVGPAPEISQREQAATSLTERRAAFVYDAARLAAVCAGAPIIPDPWAGREDGFRRQFLQVIERQCGEQRSRSPEELHGSWMQAYFALGWQHGETYDREAKTHPDLVPYAMLGELERDKDAVFIALCEIARQSIR